MLKRQTRLTFARCGIVDPRSLDDYAPMAATRAWNARWRSGRRPSSRRSRIGPARPRRRRLPDRHQVADGAAGRGRPQIHRLQCRRGRQRHLRRPHDDGRRSLLLIEGMAIAGIAVGATKGYIYIRSEYPHAIAAMNAAIAMARRDRLLGTRIAGSPSHFDIEVRVGAGAYVCGEETALLESLEGKRGRCAPSRRCRRIKGLFGKPTVINNVLSLRRRAVHPGRGRRGLCAISAWAARAARCRSSSPATSSMAGCSRSPSASRSANWSTTSAAARVSGRPVRAVQVGGPLGAYFPRALFDMPFDYEAFAAARRADRPWRHRGVRRHRRHGQAGALRHGVLRHRKLRQMHALPHRLDARRRDDRQDHRGRDVARTISRCSTISATR